MRSGIAFASLFVVACHASSHVEGGDAGVDDMSSAADGFTVIDATHDATHDAWAIDLSAHDAETLDLALTDMPIVDFSVIDAELIDIGVLDAGGDANLIDAGIDIDAGTDAGPMIDAGTDAGTVLDAGHDGGETVDAGYDAGAIDAGHDSGESFDAGHDSGAIDAGHDSGDTVDAGYDAGAIDAGPVDAGPPAWRVTNVENAANLGPVVSMAIDSAGNAHALYADPTRMRLRYARVIDDAWLVEDVGSDSPTPSSISLAVYNDVVYISYQRSDTHQLMFARLIGGTWLFENIDVAGDCGALTDIAVGISEHAQIICQEAVGLRYVYWTGATWMTEVWEASPNLTWISLSLDPWEHSHVSYYDATNQDLRYGYRIGDMVTTMAIDTVGDVGAYSSLFMDSNAEPHISYYDATNGDLKLAHWNGSMWLFSVVDTNGGRGTSIWVNSLLHPRISYIDEVLEDLKLASWDGSAWTIETIDTDIDGSLHSCLALDLGEVPQIFYAAHESEMRHAAFW